LGTAERGIRSVENAILLVLLSEPRFASATEEGETILGLASFPNMWTGHPLSSNAIESLKTRASSEEFRGHCLALTLLGSYLTDAYGGDIRRRIEVSKHLAHDVRRGAHSGKGFT
jgi:hypothetical protein